MGVLLVVGVCCSFVDLSFVALWWFRCVESGDGVNLIVSRVDVRLHFIGYL